MAITNITLSGSDRPLIENAFLHEHAAQDWLLNHPYVFCFHGTQFEDIDPLNGTDAEIRQSGGSQRMDIMVRYTNGSRAIVEVKNRALCKRDLDQLQKYLEIDDSDTPDSAPSSVAGVLAGPDIQQSLLNHIEDLEFSLACHPIVVVLFKRYRHMSNETVIMTKTTHAMPVGLDAPKPVYRYHGQTYSGSGLVWKIINDIANDRPELSGCEIKSLFKDSAGWPFNQIVTKEHAEESLTEQELRRYKHNFQTKNPIPLANGERIVVNYHWKLPDVQRLHQYMEQHPLFQPYLFTIQL